MSARTPVPAAPSAARRGFTLIEVRTATTIMVIILLAVMFIASETYRAYDDATGTLRTTAESRNALVPLQQDLESAIIRNDGNIWFQIEHEDAVGNIRKGKAPKIMLFAPVTDRIKRESRTPTPIPGDVCAIAYQLHQGSPFADGAGKPQQQAYALYRAVVDAKATFETALPAITGSDQKTTTKRTQDLLRDVWNKSAEALDEDGNRTVSNLSRWAVARQNYLASNVVSVAIVLLYYNTDSASTGGTQKRKLEALVHEDLAPAIREAFAKTGFEYDVRTYTSCVQLRAGQIILDKNEGSVINADLRSIELAVTILRPNGARDLRAIQTNDRNSVINEEKFENIVKTNSITYNAVISMAK